MTWLRATGVRRLGNIPLWSAFMAFGALLLATGVPNLIIGLRFLSTAQHASGTIVDIVDPEEFDHDRVYAPVVRFATADGRTVRFQSSETAGDRSYYRIGQPVGALYAADKPHRARIDTWESRWGRDAILPTLGLLIIGLAIVGRMRARRVQRPDRPASSRPVTVR